MMYVEWRIQNDEMNQQPIAKKPIFDRMASIVPNFEYDIFISYRHNDNKSG